MLPLPAGALLCTSLTPPGRATLRWHAGRACCSDRPGCRKDWQCCHAERHIGRADRVIWPRWVSRELHLMQPLDTCTTARTSCPQQAPGEQCAPHAVHVHLVLKTSRPTVRSLSAAILSYHFRLTAQGDDTRILDGDSVSLPAQLAAGTSGPLPRLPQHSLSTCSAFVHCAPRIRGVCTCLTVRHLPVQLPRWGPCNCCTPCASC